MSDTDGYKNKQQHKETQQHKQQTDAEKKTYCHQKIERKQLPANDMHTHTHTKEAFVLQQAIKCTCFVNTTICYSISNSDTCMYTFIYLFIESLYLQPSQLHIMNIRLFIYLLKAYSPVNYISCIRTWLHNVVQIRVYTQKGSIGLITKYCPQELPALTSQNHTK